MHGGISFSPFPLLSRECISRPGAEHSVWRLRFSCPCPLGLEQPTTHVKCRAPGALLRARTYSLTSEADADSFFEICVKLLPGGRVSPHLAALGVGDSAHFTHTLTRRLAAPLHGADARGRHLALISFGIGVTELLLTARRAAHAGQAVSLLCAVRASADALFLRELCGLAADAEGRSAKAGGSFELHLLVSREEPSEELRADVAEALAAGGAAAAARVCLRRGRVDEWEVARVFGDARWATAAALAVGSKVQAREAYALLRRVGVTQRLVGKAILWGFW